LALAIKSRLSHNYPAFISAQNMRQISKKRATYWTELLKNRKNCLEKEKKKSFRKAASCFSVGHSI